MTGCYMKCHAGLECVNLSNSTTEEPFHQQ